MRIYLRLSISREIIPYNYQPFLTGALHKWIGEENEIHGKVAFHSFSWLQNVEAKKEGIKIRNDSYFFISSYDETIFKRIVSGIREDAFVCFGSYVQEIQIRQDPTFSNSEKLFTASPVFIKRRIEDKEKHIAFNDADANLYLTQTLQKKLSLAGLSTEGVNVSFDKNYPFAKTKVISYNNIGNKVNLCPITIEGTPEQIAFAWNVGVGNSTGIGFGALK